MFDLKGRVAVVIGGGGGIGSAIAEAYSRQGAALMLAGRTAATLEETAGRIRSASGGDVGCATADVTDEQSVEALVKTVLAKFGSVDILVNAHGTNAKGQGIEFAMNDFRRLFEVNVTGVMMACKHFGRVMVEKKYGKVINLSSVRGIRGNANGNAGYCATKAAVDMITRCLAAEWAPHHVNVNAIAPPVIQTKFTEQTMAQTGRSATNTRGIPWGRIGSVADLVGTAVLLASEQSEFITGQIIYVDGGLTAVA